MKYRYFALLLFIVNTLHASMESVQSKIKDAFFLEVYISPDMIENVPRDVIYLECLKKEVNLGVKYYLANDSFSLFYLNNIEEGSLNIDPVENRKIIFDNPLLLKYDFLKVRDNTSAVHVIEKYNPDSTSKNKPRTEEYYFLRSQKGYSGLRGDFRDVVYFDWEPTRDNATRFVNAEIDAMLTLYNRSIEIYGDPLGVYIVPCEKFQDIYKDVISLYPDTKPRDYSDLKTQPQFDKDGNYWQFTYVYYIQNSFYLADIMIGNGFLIVKLDKVLSGPEYNHYPTELTPPSEIISRAVRVGDIPEEDDGAWYARCKAQLEKYHNDNKFEDEVLKILAKYGIKKDKTRNDIDWDVKLPGKANGN